MITSTGRGRVQTADINGVSQMATPDSLGGFYSLGSTSVEYVPVGRMMTIHNKTVIDGRLIVDGRAGSL